MLKDLILLYLGLKIADAFALAIAQALTNSGLNESLSKLFVTLASLLS